MRTEMEQALESRHTKPREGSKDVFERARNFTIPQQLRRAGMLPYYRALESNEGPVARFEGRELIMVGSNNYLGLTTDPRVREAAADAARRYGTSLTGSRLLNGSMHIHEELEAELADFVGKQAALVFATGYQANIGAMTALLDKEGVAVLDRLGHASITDGVRTSGAKIVKFEHNDVDQLDGLLSDIPPDRGTLVAVDGVYSMEGDTAPLPGLLPVCRKHGARLLVDDAHGIGVVGPGGRGTAALYGMQDQVDLIVGTFSKSLASVGGFIAMSSDIVDYVRFFGRSIVFSASLPPPSVAAAREALRILRSEPERVERLNSNAAYWRAGLTAAGFDVGESTTPIVPVVVGNEFTALGAWKTLMEQGVYVNAVVHPAVPRDRALLRTSVMATHTKGHLDRALSVLGTVGRRMGFAR